VSDRKKLDVDICVIGAGLGGLSVAASAAQLGASTVEPTLPPDFKQSNEG
jgi:NADPH-dependent 2,4-dienoyl-CoA reductase/sulfur reductase-like enzyme